MFGQKVTIGKNSLYFCPVACQFSKQQLKPFLRKAVFKNVKITTTTTTTTTTTREQCSIIWTRSDLMCKNQSIT